MDKMGDTQGVGLIVYTGTREELCRKLRERDDRITALELEVKLWRDRYADAIGSTPAE